MKYKAFSPIKTALSLSIILGIAYHVEQKTNSQSTNRKPAASHAPQTLLFLNHEKPTIPATKQPEEKNSASLIKEIDELASCYDKDCSRPTIDPRTDYYSLGQELKRKLSDYKNYVIQNNLRNTEVAELATKYLAHSDGHVQEVALDILSTQETSRGSLDAIIGYVINGIDPNLIHQALLELQRYKNFDDQEKIRTALGKALINGTPFVAAAIAARMNLVLNSQNISYFENLMVQLDPKSKIYLSLKYSIQEYDQHLQAG